MSAKTLTSAIRRYARRHNHYASTVRTMTVLRLAAIEEYQQWMNSSKRNVTTQSKPKSSEFATC